MSSASDRKLSEDVYCFIYAQLDRTVENSASVGDCFQLRINTLWSHAILSVHPISVYLANLIFSFKEKRRKYISTAVSEELRCLLLFFISITSQITMHMSIEHRWFDMFNPNMSHLESKASFIYALPFPFTRSWLYFSALYLYSVPTGNQVLGGALQRAFRPRLFCSFFCFFLNFVFLR